MPSFQESESAPSQPLRSDTVHGNSEESPMMLSFFGSEWRCGPFEVTFKIPTACKHTKAVRRGIVVKSLNKNNKASFLES